MMIRRYINKSKFKKIESIGKQGLVNLFNDSYKLMKKIMLLFGVLMLSNPFMTQTKYQ